MTIVDDTGFSGGDDVSESAKSFAACSLDDCAHCSAANVTVEVVSFGNLPQRLWLPVLFQVTLR
jgi:hypothetical protein